MRVVPVDARIREVHPDREALANLDQWLRLMRTVVAVIKSKSMPVDGRRVVSLVLDVDDDLRAFLDLEHGTGDRAVIGQHAHLGPCKFLNYRGNPQVELVPIAELDALGCVSLREPGGRGRKVL
jgi:hypothetical protein